MRVLFRGWRREVTPHRREVTPVERRGSTYKEKEGTALTLATFNTAFGRLNKLGLSGDFLVEFTFEDAELRNWLSVYVKHRPREAIRLLAEMQAEAVLALHSPGSTEQL